MLQRKASTSKASAQSHSEAELRDDPARYDDTHTVNLPAAGNAASRVEKKPRLNYDKKSEDSLEHVELLWSLNRASA